MALREKLSLYGYRAVAQVEEHGEFSARGSILDLFPMGSSSPFRIDFFDDEVESIRSFDAATQRSLESCESTSVTMLDATEAGKAHFTSHLGESAWFALVEPADLAEEGRFFHERARRVARAGA